MKCLIYLFTVTMIAVAQAGEPASTTLSASDTVRLDTVTYAMFDGRIICKMPLLIVIRRETNTRELILFFSEEDLAKFFIQAAGAATTVKSKDVIQPQYINESQQRAIDELQKRFERK